MFSPSRDQARQFMFETWRKYQAGEPLGDSEKIALRVIAMHTEYHAMLADAERNLNRDYAPEDGAINPFLHLSLHYAVEEQITIDQPAGIRGHYERIAAASGSEHDAKHALIECLGEMLWQAQRNGSAPDPARYFSCLEDKHRV